MARRGRPPKPDNELSYHGLHGRLNQRRGPASAQLCVDCGEPAEEWSYQGNSPYEKTQIHPRRGSILVYSFNLDDYQPRCVQCHNWHELQLKSPSPLFGGAPMKARKTKSFSLPAELVERMSTYSRLEVPNWSGLVTRLLTRELDRLDAARARKTTANDTKDA
jgi:hypothetical protein